MTGRRIKGWLGKMRGGGGGAKGWKNARKPSGVVGYKKRGHREISSDRLASHYLQHV